MKLITKENFPSVYCKVFTIMALCGAIIDSISEGGVNHARFNLFSIAIFSLIGVTILSQSWRLSKLPLLRALIVLYLTALACVYAIVGILILMGRPIHPNGLAHVFRSFSIPYLTGSLIYLYRVKKETQKQNEDILMIRRLQDEMQEKTPDSGKRFPDTHRS